MQQLSVNGSQPAMQPETETAAHRAALEELTRDPNCHLLVLEVDGAIQATCTVYILPNIPHRGARWAVVEHVVVDEDQRSLGYGEYLMTEAERLARSAGAYRLSLMSGEQRTGAHRFYNRIGYEPSHQGFTKYFS